MTDRWKNRRRMAWSALIAGMLFPLLVLFTDSDQLSGIAASLYVFLAAIVGAYIGFVTLDDKYQKDVR